MSGLFVRLREEEHLEVTVGGYWDKHDGTPGITLELCAGIIDKGLVDRLSCIHLFRISKSRKLQGYIIGT